MKKPITKKYFIESVLADSFSSKVQITSSKFSAALKDAEKKFNEQEAQEGNDFYIERNTRKFENDTMIETWVEFTWGGSSTYFITLECKSGYCFKK